MVRSCLSRAGWPTVRWTEESGVCLGVWHCHRKLDSIGQGIICSNGRQGFGKTFTRTGNWNWWFRATGSVRVVRMLGHRLNGTDMLEGLLLLFRPMKMGCHECQFHILNVFCVKLYNQQKRGYIWIVGQLVLSPFYTNSSSNMFVSLHKGNKDFDRWWYKLILKGMRPLQHSKITNTSNFYSYQIFCFAISWMVAYSWHKQMNKLSCAVKNKQQMWSDLVIVCLKFLTIMPPIGSNYYLMYYIGCRSQTKIATIRPLLNPLIVSFLHQLPNTDVAGNFLVVNC